MSDHVCLSLQLHQFLCTVSPTAWRYVVCFRFCVWRHVCPIIGQTKATRVIPWCLHRRSRCGTVCLCCAARHVGVMRVIPGCRLRVEIQFNTTGEWLWAEYDNMTVQSESDNYRLHVTGYRGNADDAFNRGDQWDRRRSNGMEFSTKDVDNDQRANRTCAKRWKCGWWFNSCSSSSLNCLGGKWLNKQHQSKPRASRMMLQCDAG